MSPRQQNSINEKKTGLLFFTFLLIVALFLLYAFWDQEQGALPANQNNNNQTVLSNTNQSSPNANQNENSNTPSNLNSNANPVINNQLSSSKYGFFFPLQTGETVKETEAEDIHAFQLNNNDKIVVLPAELLDFVKSDNGAVSEEVVKVDGVSGQRVNGVDARDGSKIEFIVVVHKNQLYDFHGSSEFLDRITEFFKFTN